VAEVENIELRSQAEDLRLAIRQSELRTRLYQDQREIAAVQAEEESRQALITEYQQRSEQLARSKLSAPAKGKVLAADVQRLIGTYVQEGDELLSIGEESHKKIELSIAQEDVELFRQFVGQNVKAILRGPGHDPVECRLTRIEPRGSQALSHPALAASADGPIPVQPVQVDSSNTKEEAQQEWEYVEPRFVGVADLSTDQSMTLRAGQTATVKLQTSRGTLGQYLYRTVTKWVRARVDRTIG
jgi:hypothetical protein